MAGSKALELDTQICPQTSMEFFLKHGADQRVLDCWDVYGIKTGAAILLGFDSLYLIFYTIFLITLARHLSFELKQDFGKDAVKWLVVCLPKIAALSVLTLAFIDILENILGILGILGITSGWRLGSAVCFFNTWKSNFIRIILVLLGFLLSAWYFNFFNPARNDPNTHDTRFDERARLRVASADMVWRSRYVLLALLLFGGLTIVMDQSRDVLAGMAQGMSQNLHEIKFGWSGLLSGLVGFGSFLIHFVAIWLFAYTCWFWVRVVGRMQRPDDDVKCHVVGCPKRNRSAEARDIFAKWWARLLGIAPFLMLTWMCGLAAQAAVRSGDLKAALVLIIFGSVLFFLPILMIRFRGQDPRTRAMDKSEYIYYDYLVDDKAQNNKVKEELWGNNYRFLRCFSCPPALLPILSLVLLEVVRFWSISESAPPLALAAIAFALTFWTSLLGLLAQAALRRAIPWVLILILLVGGLGFFDLTDNHRVWHAYPVGDETVVDLVSTMHLHQFTLALLALLAVCALALYNKFPPHKDNALSIKIIASLILLGATFAVLKLADNHLQPLSRTVAATSLQDRPSLDDAIGQWISAHHVKQQSLNNLSSPITVYFVSAEGGGIRSAYWTALVLAKLTEQDNTFPNNLFSLSGVSGGAVGETVWRSCLIKSRGQKGIGQMDCVKSLGKTDLLTPLLSAWMFEDTLARAIPTSAWCELPGCGFLSRGIWFERNLENAIPGLDDPMVGSIQSGVPHLFLNSTWVETGERAIASTIRIEHKQFPTAHDQLEQLGSDLPLSTAAHNAARFTYVNAIGSVVNGATKLGHLADGGYFDNSGGHTTGDILRAFQRCVFSPDDPCRLGVQQQKWAQENLFPQAIQIRNGVVDDGAGNDPAQPLRKGRWELYTDIFGPLIAAFNAIGTGSNGRVAESLLAKQIESWRDVRLLFQSAPVSGTEIKMPEPVIHCDLKEEGTLYPLGWYLSETARKGMEHEAKPLPLSCQL